RAYWWHRSNARSGCLLVAGFSNRGDVSACSCNSEPFTAAARPRLKSHFLGAEMAESQQQQGIPTRLSCEQFRQFVLPHLTVGRRGPAPKLTLLAIFNYILRLLYLGCQWKEL